ncbi:MAG: hypothetical protein F4W93_07445 [Dehalococcoidia bacterium]|nr:hypothetical protein [Dehalococcoidia bacterium]
MSKAALDAITDKVLAHETTARKPLKVIAGEPDSPLVIGDIEIPCYVLEDETRVLSQRGFIGALAMSPGSRGKRTNGDDQIAAFLRGNALAPHVHAETLAATRNPILFTPPHGGRTAFGYSATLLTDICDVVLAAREAGALLPQQHHVAERCELLVRGLARVGIIGLVDEATGYERIREECALAKILEAFLDEELHPWTKTFDFSFYEQIFRLRGWGSASGVKRPRVIGHYTNDLVYERIAPGVLAELRERNPVLPQGWRKNRHHQWFTPEFGHPKLLQHIEGVTALMRAAGSWESFKRALDRAYPKTGSQFSMPEAEVK